MEGRNMSMVLSPDKKALDARREGRRSGTELQQPSARPTRAADADDRPTPSAQTAPADTADSRRTPTATADRQPITPPGIRRP